MSVIVSIESAGTSQKVVKIAVPGPAVEAETQRVSADYRKKVKLPGFRKGKVPEEMMRKRFGEDIQQEVVERLVPRYWKQAEAEGSLEPMLTPTLGAVEHEYGESLTFEATVDVVPEFELRNTTDFELPDVPTVPTEEEIAETFEDLRRNVAEFVEVDRPAGEGDLVKAELVELVDSVLVSPTGEDLGGEEKEPQNVAFEIGHPQVWEELGLAATGLAKEQTATFEREVTPEVPEEGEEGAKGETAQTIKTRYRLTVASVEERDLPDLDDEFAAKVGKFDSLEALRADLVKRMQESKEVERRRTREHALMQQLVARHPLEVSDRVIHHEIEKILTDYATDLSMQGVDVENAEIEWEKLGEQVRPQAQHRVKARLITDRIAAERGLTATEEELESALARIGQREGKSVGAVRMALDRAGKLGPLREQLKRDKTVRDLLGETKETPEAESGAELSGESSAESSTESSDAVSESHTEPDPSATTED